MKHRVVITGWGLVTSLSCDIEDCWTRMLAGESGIHDVRLFDCSDIKVSIGGDVWDWDPSETIGSKEAKRWTGIPSLPWSAPKTLLNRVGLILVNTPTTRRDMVA